MSCVDYLSNPLPIRPYHVAYQHVANAFSAKASLAQRIADFVWALFESIPLFNYPVLWLDAWVHQRSLYDAFVPVKADIPVYPGDPLENPLDISFEFEPIRDQMTQPLMRAVDVKGNPVLLFKQEKGNEQLFIAIFQKDQLIFRTRNGPSFGDRTFIAYDKNFSIESIRAFLASEKELSSALIFSIAPYILLNNTRLPQDLVGKTLSFVG